MMGLISFHMGEGTQRRRSFVLVATIGCSLAGIATVYYVLWARKRARRDRKKETNEDCE